MNLGLSHLYHFAAFSFRSCAGRGLCAGNLLNRSDLQPLRWAELPAFAQLDEPLHSKPTIGQSVLVGSSNSFSMRRLFDLYLTALTYPSAAPFSALNAGSFVNIMHFGHEFGFLSSYCLKLLLFTRRSALPNLKHDEIGRQTCILSKVEPAC